MTAPLLTCVLIFLDGERYIDEAIRSVVAQTGDDWELILVDDGSTDDSTAIARAWAAADPARIRYIDHPGHANVGMSASRNAGVAAARGSYVGFLDCDDVWLPCVLAHTRRLLAAHPGVDVVIGGTWRWYSWTGVADDVARDQLMSQPAVVPDTVVEPPDLFTAVYGTPGGWRVPAMCSLLVRRDALVGIGGMEAEFRGLYEDQVLYTKLALRLRTVVDPRPLALYRQHPESACERSIADGSWQRIGPSEPAARFLRWMQGYVEATTGSDAPQAAIVRHNVAHDGWWTEPAPAPRWPRLRAAVPAPARQLVRRLRASRRVPGPSVVAVWSEQYLRAAVAAMTGNVLVTTSATTSGEDWVDEVPDDAFPPTARVVHQQLPAAAGPVFDHVVVPLGTSGATPAADVVRRAAAAVRPGGRAAVVVRAPVPDATSGCGVALSVETFGSAVAARAVAAGIEAAALGVAIDRHDPAAPVLAAVTIERAP